MCHAVVINSTLVIICMSLFYTILCGGGSMDQLRTSSTVIRYAGNAFERH